MITWLRVALTGGFLAYRALFVFLTPFLFVTTVLATPILQIAYFGLLGPAVSGLPVEVFVVGNAVQASAIAGIIAMPQMIDGERTFGTLPYLVLSPASRSAVYLGRMVPTILNGILVVAVGLIFGALVFDARILGPAPATLLAAIGLSVFSCTALGVLLGALGFVVRDMLTLAGTAYLMLLLVSGANVPIADLPGWLQPLSAVAPLTRGIAVARGTVSGTGGDPTNALLGEFAIGVVYATLGYCLLRFFERRSLVAGSLEQF